jgi:hypothetical protein
MRTRTTSTGAEYILDFNGLYFWKTKSGVAEELKGSYLDPKSALDAFKVYNSKLTITPDVSGAQKPLEELTGKAELLGWAKVNGVDVPEKYKHPSSIKKFLQGGYENA